MPSKGNRPRPASRSHSSALAGSHSDARAQFDRLVTSSLASLLGKARLTELRRHPAVVSSLGDGVVVHSAVSFRGPMTLERISKEKPIIGVVANSIPLRDPGSLTELKPGAYVVRLRRIGKTSVAFDFFSGRSDPDHSVHAHPTQSTATGLDIPLGGSWKIDVDITLPWDPDSFSPPDGTEGKFCLSLFSWGHCWDWAWPKIKWPW